MQAPNVDRNQTEKVEITSNAADEEITAEKADKELEVEEADDASEQDNSNTKMESDCDIYIFRYWDNFNTSKTQEALDYIEKNIKQNFKKNKVKDSDQIYKVHKSENLEDNEIKVKVKLKKNNWSVERSAGNVQTASQPGDPVSVSIKTILR